MSILPEPRKRCSKCKEKKPLEAFQVDRSRRDGRQYVCRACRKLHREQNYEEALEKDARYRAANPEKRRFFTRRWRENNPEKALTCSLDSYYRHRPKRLVQKRLSYRANAPENRARATAYREANPEACKAQQKLYRQKNPLLFRSHGHKYRAKKRGAAGSFTAADILCKLELQGGLCYYCGADLSETGYHIDHKIPLAQGGSNWPANLCCACPRCNSSKRDMDFYEFLERLAA